MTKKLVNQTYFWDKESTRYTQENIKLKRLDDYSKEFKFFKGGGKDIKNIQIAQFFTPQPNIIIGTIKICIKLEEKRIADFAIKFLLTLVKSFFLKILKY